jgi:hypothetical protein
MTTDVQPGESWEAKLCRVLDTKLEKCTVSVCLAQVETNNPIPSFKILQISSDLALTFKRIFEIFCKKWRGAFDSHNAKCHQYEPDSKPDSHEIECINIKEHILIEKQLEPLRSLADLAIFNQNLTLGQLHFYVIIVQPEHGEPIYLFRKYNKSKELSQSSKFVAIFQDGHFDRVRKPIFLFDQIIDCVVVEKTIFIISKTRFQRIFRFFDLVKKHADKTLEQIQVTIPISNFADFKEACQSDQLMLSKLISIGNKTYLSAIKIENLRKVIELAELKIEIVSTEAGEALLFDRKKKWELLKLLNDDYLKSDMTGRLYEVSGKRSR